MNKQFKVNGRVTFKIKGTVFCGEHEVDEVIAENIEEYVEYHTAEIEIDDIEEQ